MLKVLSVFGTRPEAIKMAPIVHELGRRPEQIESRICVTAQHREMLDQVLEIFDVHPHHDLQIMRDNQRLSDVTASVFTRLEPVLEQERPDWVIVQGDTTTVMAAALVAFYHRSRVGHVEAGLRTGDKFHPFPEEINRRVASVVADLHFAPTSASRDNLLREGISRDAVIVTGNPVIDALHAALKKPFRVEDTPLASVPLSGRRVILVTAHRRENFGRPLEGICHSLSRIAKAYPDVQLVYPVHLNPNVQEPVYRLLGSTPGVSLLPPLDYLSFINVMNRAELVLTDSGGLQEEAPALHKPVLVMRETTERPEGVAAGVSRLVGTDPEKIYTSVSELLDDSENYQIMASAQNPYGDGTAAQQIVDALMAYSR
jgi:UDP-N-acetylglucosamine 2-epimerase (non-hydrolysing)